MGKVMSMLTRKAQRFNVESRAHRFLDRDKPTRAPQFEDTKLDIKRALEVEPELVEKLNRKDVGLDNRLKDVFVTSEDSFIDYASKREVDPKKPLPLDRSVPQYFEYGYQEPRIISHGRCTLRQALQFITDHQTNSDLWTAKKIADDFKLKEKQVANILQYFKIFAIHIPDKKAKDSLLTQAQKKLLGSKNEAT